jgi:hypothetical protein
MMQPIEIDSYAWMAPVGPYATYEEMRYNKKVCKVDYTSVLYIHNLSITILPYSHFELIITKEPENLFIRLIKWLHFRFVEKKNLFGGKRH